MKSELAYILKNLHSDEAPSSLFPSIKKEIAILHIRKVLFALISAVSLGAVGSVWYLYSRMSELDSVSIFRYSLSTLEFDLGSIKESLAFALGFMPLAALSLVAFNVILFGTLLYARHVISRGAHIMQRNFQGSF